MTTLRAIVGGVVLVLALLLWAPWFSARDAELRAAEAFTSAWQDVVDGCGFNCDGCGVRESHRLTIGYSVEIEYACGLLPSDSPEFHQRDVVYVSPFGSVHLPAGHWQPW